MKKILVAGGAGYVGTRFCNEYCDIYDITVVDLFWFGDNLNNKVTKIKSDIINLTVDDVSGFDAVIFLAGLSNDPMAGYRPDLNFIGNSSVPTYLAFICKQAGVKRFICASSCSVYGFTDNQILDELDTVKPAYPYGISKLQCETGVSVLEDATFKPILFRKGTVGGFSERMRYDLVVNTMIMSGISKGKITVNNKNLWRPLIDIRDVINGYRLAIEADESISGVYNLSGFNYTIGELGEVITNELRNRGYSVELELLTNPDVRNYKVSTSKIEAAIGYKPRYTPIDTVNELFDRIDFNNYDFANQDFYNIDIFKQVIE
jgi:nucleoside-diphosphate-sugar epimerase